MALSVGRRHGGPVAEINVTPMADVMIVLLIIFLVAAPIVIHTPVRLPAAMHPTEHKGDMLKLVVRADGDVIVEGAALADSVSLPDYLAARASATRSLLVMIEADRDASYTDVERVLAACRASGVSEVALGAELRAGG